MYRCSWIAVLAWVITGPAERVVLAESPLPPEADAGESVSAPASKLDQVQQLLEAAKHLDAADDVELARQVRRKAGQLLLEESDRLTQEQRRHDSLSLALDPHPIIVQALIAETQDLPRDALVRVIQQAGGRPVSSESFDSNAGDIAAILGPSTTGNDLLRALQKVVDGLAVVSRPQVMTLDGTPAEIQIGETRRIIQGVKVSDQGVSVPEYADEEAGIRMSIIPTITSENQIQLELAAEKSEFMEQEVPIFTDPASGKTITTPIKSIKTMQTSVKVPDGRVLLLSVDLEPNAANAQRGEHETRPTLLLLLEPRQVREQR
jgi:hypothetical protein